MKCKLTPGLSSGDWNEFCSRFHFPPDDLPHIQAIYTALLPLVESYAYYSLDQDLDGISLPHYAYGFVTLGNGVDELSELYLNHEQIQEAYIVDCISLMLLSKAYEEFSPKASWNGSQYTNVDTGVKSDNTFLVYQDTYIMGDPGKYMGSTEIEVPEKYFTTK